MPPACTNERRKVTQYSVSLMILTSIHHAYGAFIYHTPWRLHVLFLSIPSMIILLAVGRLYARSNNSKWLYGLYWLITLLIPILLIGVFEGLYNHVLKNTLFFSGLPTGMMHSFYPAGTYEMPDDLLFELTGVMQGIIAILLIRRFVHLTGCNRRYRHLLKSNKKP